MKTPALGDPETSLPSFGEWAGANEDADANEGMKPLTSFADQETAASLH